MAFGERRPRQSRDCDADGVLRREAKNLTEITVKGDEHTACGPTCLVEGEVVAATHPLHHHGRHVVAFGRQYVASELAEIFVEL
jgi:hypothetical protein